MLLSFKNQRLKNFPSIINRTSRSGVHIQQSSTYRKQIGGALKKKMRYTSFFAVLLAVFYIACCMIDDSHQKPVLTILTANQHKNIARKPAPHRGRNESVQKSNKERAGQFNRGPYAPRKPKKFREGPASEIRRDAFTFS